ncbi:hypothetical protein HUK80_14835 [Flavobacterium sp. MAH-1]|uniref:Uncharacterized protein n=1 Tax=Flavobacterium agri TaxID=2743471 RepID=A0A7Y8Y4F6_9FLAO|nr:hypothetical protein [Flavobacterium agri]NUY82178.1 hypothetical protein [Flavobacterium agri]NYA72202.1 hypothetical protein [Flavobacterium agri]
MRRFIFTFCALLFVTIASAQTDSIRKGKKDPNKTEKSVKATKKTDAPRDTISTKRQNNRRSTQSPSTQPNNSTDPAKMPPATPTTPPPGYPSNPNSPTPTSPTGQP